jgi:signal transduction histidine kinase
MSVLPRLFILVLIAVLPALAIQASNEFDLRRSREAEVRQNALRLAQFASGELDRIVDNARVLLTALSKLAALRDHDAPACNAYLSELKQSLPQYTIVGALDVDGAPFCASADIMGQTAADRPYFKRALATGRFTIGEYTVGRILPKPVLPFALPFAGADGRPAGIVYLSLDLAWLAAHFEDRSFDGNATLAVTDRDGIVLLRIPDNAKFAGTRFAESYMAQVHAEAAGTEEITGIDGVVRIIGYVPADASPNRLFVGVGLTKAVSFASIDRATESGFVLIAAGLSLALLAAWIGGRQFISRPIHRLVDAAAQWTEGRFEARANLGGGRSEMARLGATFDAMAGALERRGAERDRAEAARAATAVELERLNETLAERVATEIAARTKAEAAYRQAQKMDAIGQLTGGIAHDFNNILQVIMGNVEALHLRAVEEQRPIAPEAVSKSTLAALQAARRAASLTYRLLAFARQQPLSPEPVDANRLVSGMSDLIRRTLGETINSETVLAGGLWPVFADPNQLESALLNLAVNARDAMPEGGRLTIETANCYLDDAYAEAHGDVSPGQYVLIGVSDTGKGMAPEIAANAFDPFFTTKAPGEGTGLGLSQVYGFVKQSNGHVKIYSEPGQGTSVKIYLPRGANIASAVPETAPEQAPARAPNATILVVEDDDDVRASSIAMLHKLGYAVLDASDGAAALHVLADRPDIALLFTDVGLPGGLNGRQLADAAVARLPGLKVLFTTGYARNAIVHNRRLDPGVELLTKPFTYAALAAKLRKILEAERA